MMIFNRKISVVFLTGLAMLLSSCAEEENFTSGQTILGSEIDYRAEVDSNEITKVCLLSGQSSWEMQDRIAIFEDFVAPAEYRVKSLGDEGRSAVFSGIPLSGASSGVLAGNNVAVYPFVPSLVCGYNGSSFHVSGYTFPFHQTYRKDSFDVCAVPMMACSANRSLYFRNVAGLFRLKLVGNARIRSVRIESNDGLQMAGPMVMCSKDRVLISSWDVAGKGGSRFVELDCSADGGVALDSNVPVAFNIGILPISAVNGFKVTVTDVEGGSMVLVTQKHISVVASRVLDMATVEYVPDSSRKGLLPVQSRVDIQSSFASAQNIVDGSWVAVGLKKDYAVQLDYDNLYKGLHSYRFELKGGEDNTLGSYSGGRKGRVEMSWCYASENDFSGLPSTVLSDASILKTVYYHGKGYCQQASSMKYTFAVMVPSSMPDNASGIFAQWHGMPSRTLTRNPEGVLKEMTDAEFIALEKTMIIDKDLGYERLPDGKKGNPNGWRFEQGGYPPMSFAFGKGYFYIQANSDRSWLTDKSIRCNINPSEAEVGDYREAGPVEGGLGVKRSTLAYKMPIKDFPRNCWVTFDIQVDWTKYGKEAETAEGGRLDVVMSWPEPGKKDGPVISRHIVDGMDVLIGRNDHKGYYFKFGIYRADGSEIPVSWNLAGYEEERIK